MVMNHQMGKIPVEMSFSDYKVIDGIPFPATITNTVGPATMVMKMKEVKLNAEIDDAKFVVPEEAKKLAEPQKPPSTRSTKDSGKPTAATLLDKYLEADGGFDAISKHPITRTVAEVTPPENRPKFKQVMQRSGVNTRTVEDRGLTKVVSGIFDGHGYSYIEYQGNPQSSKLLPRELSENQLKSLAEPALLRSPFADESKLSVEGPEKVQGRATWKLSGQDRLGGELVWWIDAEQFVPLKQIHTPSATDGAGMPMESVYEDYRKVGPRIFSHRQTFVRSDRPGGTDRFSTVYQYTTVEVNGKVEPADLLPPRPIQKLIEEAKATTRPAEGK
jgi:hypothetical protein